MENRNKFWKGVLVGALAMAFVCLVVVGLSTCIYMWWNTSLSNAAGSLTRGPGVVNTAGEEEKELNRIFGRQMAAACSIAILIGKKRSEPLHEGLREGGFAEENIHVVANLDEATALLARTTQPGDVVLFENDLPDNYDE